MTGVIAAYNQEAFISKSIESLAYQCDEVVVVDDCSSDGTFRQIAISAKGHSKIRIARNTARMGPSYSFNRGVRLSGNGIVLLQGGDDVAEPWRRVEQEGLLKASEGLVSVCLPSYISDTGESLLHALHSRGEPFWKPKRELIGLALLLQGNFINAPSMGIWKSKWEEIGGFNPNYYHLQDYDFWLRASKVCTVDISEASWLKYRLHSASLSSSFRLYAHPQELEEISKEWTYLVTDFIDSLSTTELAKLLNVRGFLATDEISLANNLKGALARLSRVPLSRLNRSIKYGDR